MLFLNNAIEKLIIIYPDLSDYKKFSSYKFSNTNKLFETAT